MKLKQVSYILFAATLVISSCKKDDPPLPAITAQFEAAALGISSDDSSEDFDITLSRAATTDVIVEISITETGVVYGTDYTTTPAASAGKIIVTIPAGSSEAEINVSKSSGLLLYGEEQLTFNITSVSTGISIGTTAQLVLSFDEILSDAASLQVNGGGVTYPNKVFIDLSANKQTSVLRTDWDLGFYAGDDFRVILNSSTAMMAKVIDKNDLNAVTAADTVGFAEQMSLMAFSTDAMAYIDEPSGDITKTAIAAVAENADDNKVYIINRGSGVASAPGAPAPSRGWKKIRVIRNAGGYTLQYADIDATTFQETTITKDAAYNFNYVHFDNGAVAVEPAKDKWDIAWGYFTNATNFGTGLIPYAFQDMILQNNHSGIETAKVLGADIAYADFAEADIASLTFSNSQTGIGADWRFTQPAPAAVYTDRYYIVKDAGGNYYKLKFTALATDGERGKPSFEYALVKAGE